jgi:hypothetical protein
MCYLFNKMSGFPLYDNLIKDLPKKDLSVKDKEQFIADIKKMNATGQELVYALILVYYRQNERSASKEQVPYKGIKKNEGEDEDGIFNFSWVYTRFPIKLRHLLSRFSKMHLQKQQEEVDRTSQVF